MPLIRPKVSLSGPSKQALDKVRQRIQAAGDAYVTVGVLEGSGQYSDGANVVDVALANEFGTGKIPERSFLRSAVDGNLGLINRWRGEALRNMLEKGWSVEKALEMIGFRVQVLVQNRIKSNISPENAAYTQDQKRAAGVAQRTLMFTTLLLRSIRYQVFTQAKD